MIVFILLLVRAGYPYNLYCDNSVRHFGFDFFKLCEYHLTVGIFLDKLVVH